jgi:hypothetical protein
MKYEIPREAFKQRLENRLNFVLVDLLPVEKTPVRFENVVNMSYSSNFKSDFSSKYPDKKQNIILYSLEKNDQTPAKAASELEELGYHFVY